MFRDSGSSRETKEKGRGSTQSSRDLIYDNVCANQVSPWRKDSAQTGTHIWFDDDGNTRGKRSGTSSPRKGKHTRFGDNEKTVTEDAMEVSLDALDHYQRLGNMISYLDDVNDAEWRAGTTRQKIMKVSEIIKDKVGHEEFCVVHHTFSKATLEKINFRLTDSQRRELAGKLDIHLTKNNQALSNLYSNLSMGPHPNNRKCDPGASLDATFYQVEDYEQLEMDPRSKQYQIIDRFMQPRDDTREFSNQEFTQYILRPLEKAEKLHVVLTGGYDINSEVSMWKPRSNNKWKKVPINISEYEWGRMQVRIKYAERDDISLLDLKRDFPDKT